MRSKNAVAQAAAGLRPAWTGEAPVPTLAF